MRSKILLFCCTSFILIGCHTWGQFDQGLNNLSDMDHASRVLGYPDGSYEVGNDLVYVWSRSSSGSYTLPKQETSYHSGSVYGNTGGSAYYSGSTTSTTYQTYNFNHSCEIKIIVSKTNPKRIKTWNYDGNLGGCGPYIQRLKNAGLVK